MSKGSFNWDGLNKMLRDGQLWCDDVNNSNESSAIELTFNGDHQCLLNGVKFIFENSNLIAQLENQHNDGQPIECTLKHLDVAKAFCHAEFSEKFVDAHCLDATHTRPLSQFLLECFFSKFGESVKIITDSKRLPLIKTAFGDNFVEEMKLDVSTSKRRQIKRNCAQIIFESGDIESATDLLFANLSDRTIAPWRINSVYVQETVRGDFYKEVNDRLKALNGLESSPILQTNFNGNELAQKFGGKFIESDNKLIALLTETLPKYVKSIDEEEMPVAVSFFRTAKEVAQLINGDDDNGVKSDLKSASIWTENISLFYELANNLNARNIWVNCIGIYHQLLRQNGVFNTGSNDCSLSIQAGKICFHCFIEKRGPKHLIIPFGKTFAN